MLRRHADGGVARQLVHAAVDRAARHQGRQVWLKVLSTNVPAIELYSSLGFVELARTPEAFEQRPGADDLRLARSLGVASPGLMG
ncbi:GNAT family N-acetyltransferase [Kocuria tytonis]|uniref:GNAT family N-acetyltransferase n=1 Tax=Kocuria tytonis TaxID=2054280 RepID=UPI0038991D1B